jgi:hypothetical protein
MDPQRITAKQYAEAMDSLQRVINAHWPNASVLFRPMFMDNRSYGGMIVSGINLGIAVRPVGDKLRWPSGVVAPAECLVDTSVGRQLTILEGAVDQYIRGRKIYPVLHPIEIWFVQTWPLFASCFRIKCIIDGNIPRIYARGDIGVSWYTHIYSHGMDCSHLDDAERFIATRLLCYEIQKILPQPIAEEVTWHVNPTSMLLNYQYEE